MSPKKLKKWTVAQKMAIIQAREKGLTCDEVCSLYGVNKDSIWRWSTEYRRHGLKGLEDKRKQNRPPRLSSKVRAAERVMDGLAGEHPGGGIGKLQGTLYRHGFLSLAKETVRRMLQRKGQEMPKVPRRRGKNKPYKAHKFERARPNELWQTDIMGFMLKGQYRVYLIGFMDDNSRFIVGWGLSRFQTTANVMEVFRGGIEKHGVPKEVLSDNGRQYYTWRGSNKFSKMLVKLGVRHIRSRPYHPQTQGKIESFWRNLHQECLSVTPFSSFEEAQEKIGEYIEYYNFKRPHQGIENLIPADKYFSVASQVKELVRDNSEQVENKTAEEVREYKKPTYLVGNLGGQELRIFARDARVSLEKPAPEMVESTHQDAGTTPGDTEKADHGRPESETTKGEGAVETVVAGPLREEGRDGTLPGSGDIAGVVLSLVGTPEGGRAGCAGGGTAGPGEGEGCLAGTGEETLGESGGSAQEAEEGPQGTGTPGTGGEHGQEDHPAPGLG